MRRLAFTLLFILNTGVAGATGYAVSEYQHLKKDYDDLRVIARNNLMELEQANDRGRSCNASLSDIKEKLYGPADFVRATSHTVTAGR